MYSHRPNLKQTPEKPTKKMVGLRGIVLPVYLPSILLMIGHSLVVPVIPNLGDSLGLSIAEIGLIFSARFMLPPFVDVFVGPLMGRIGLKGTLLLGILAMVSGGVMGFFAGGFWVLFVARLLEGVSYALWNNTSHVYIALNLDDSKKGRGSAFYGMMERYAFVIGPVVGGVVATFVGISVPFLAQAVVGLLSTLVVLSLLKKPHIGVQHESLPVLGDKLLKTLIKDKRPLIAVGVLAFATLFIRAAREALIPFQATELGVSVLATGYIVSASYIADALVAPISGVVMDRFGLKVNAVPALLIMSAVIVAMPHIGSVPLLIAASIVIGVANGTTAGVVLASLLFMAPKNREGEFITLGRIFADGGNILGPLINTLFTNLLIVAGVVSGGVGVLGVLSILFLMPKNRLKKDFAKSDKPNE